MQDRIQAELALLREPYPNMEYQAEGRWFLIPAYSLPKGWNRETTDIAFQVDESYPCAHPYGFFVRSGILFQGATPGNYQDTVPNQPPFEGPWGSIFLVSLERMVCIC